MKNTINTYAVVNYIYQVIAQAKACGIYISEENCFEKFSDTVKKAEGRGPVTTVFDHRHNPFTPENAFWIHGVDKMGETVHLQAARLDHLSNISLAEYLAKNAWIFSPPSAPVVPEKSKFDLNPYAHDLTGALCYHGEFWLSSNGTYRGQGLVPLLARATLAIALLKWQPDYVYGLVPPALMQRGLAAKYGYNHSHPQGASWFIPNDTDPMDEYLVWNSKRDLIQLVS